MQLLTCNLCRANDPANSQLTAAGHESQQAAYAGQCSCSPNGRHTHELQQNIFLKENSLSLQRSSTRCAHQWRAPQQRGHRTARPGHLRAMCMEPHDSRPARQTSLASPQPARRQAQLGHSSSYAFSGPTISKLDWASLQCRHGRQRRGHPHILSLRHSVHSKSKCSR